MANPNPSPDTQWQPGQSGNPGGKTSEHRKAEIRAAELAAIARLHLVEAFARLVQGKASDDDRLSLMNSDALKLLKESEDRGFGLPKSSLDLSSEDGSMSPPSVVQIVPVVSDASQSDAECR
jgi:hypothetical protein